MVNNIRKQGNKYYKDDPKSNDIDISASTNASTSESQENFRDPLIGITLNNSNALNERTPAQKHVNIASINCNHQAEIFGYTTSSAGYSKDRHNHGIPKNIKLSSTKMDNSFIPEIVVQKNEGYTSNKIDFIVGYTESQTKGGQYFKPADGIMIADKDNYKVSELGTDYIHNNSEVEKKLQNIQKNVKATNIYNTYDSTETNSTLTNANANNDNDNDKNNDET